MVCHFKRRLLACVLLVCLLIPMTAALGAAEPMNLLLIGVDGYGEDSVGRSDTMVLLHIDPARKDVRMVSFLRDMYVSIPGHGKTRLNAAYFYGGEALLKKTLSAAFDIGIDHTVTVNFSMLEELIDALGGVEIDVTEAELPHLNDVLMAYNKKTGLSPKYELVTAAGEQRLSGKQALSYSRIRKLDSDFKRASRQQTVIKAMLHQLKELDFFSLARLVAGQLNKVRTDLSLWDINALLPLLTAGGELELRSAQAPFPGTFSEETINGMQVLNADLKQNARKIAAFLSEE